MPPDLIRPALYDIRAVIIDLDGTMVDTAPDFLVAVNRMRDGLALAPLSIEQIKTFVGKGSENLIRRVLQVGVAPARIETLFPVALASYLEHYRAINGAHVTVYPGVREGLAAFHSAGLRMACVTNKPYDFADVLLRHCGLRDDFELLYGGDSLAAKKPDPLPMLRVCADFDLAPRQVLAIGDSVNDAIAARAAGCRVLTVPYGYNHGEDVHGIDSDGIVSTLLDAARLVLPASSGWSGDSRQDPMSNNPTTQS